jgi:hypothetical protein
VRLFDVSDYQYSAEATSPYMDLLRGHGEDELDTRRMSVLESIPLEYSMTWMVESTGSAKKLIFRQ